MCNCVFRMNVNDYTCLYLLPLSKYYHVLSLPMSNLEYFPFEYSTDCGRHMATFFYRDAMHSADYAVARCLSGCLLSVTRRFLSKRVTSSNFFHQTLWQYYDGDPLTMAKIAIFDQYLALRSMTLERRAWIKLRLYSTCVYGSKRTRNAAHQ